ncbi:unnamed protein product [Choristocarpus tenellus]
MCRSARLRLSFLLSMGPNESICLPHVMIIIYFCACSVHCDEALACAMLKILPAWSGAVIVRTRDEEELAKCNVVVDVGGIYDPKTLRFDHHQKTFSDTLSEESFSTKLSSAGLVYRHFGHEILTRMVEGTSIPKEVVNKKFYGRVYKSFVEHIDGIDNGIMVADGMMKYQVSSTLSDRVAKLNPHWNEEAEDGPLLANERFKQAMSLASGEFIETVLGLSNSWWPGRAIVQDSISMRKEAHPSGQVVVLTGYCPWKSHLVEIEEEMGLGGEFKYVLYAEGGNSKSWRIQAVPLVEGSFELRLGLPKEWRGLRNAELSTASGIEGTLQCPTVDCQVARNKETGDSNCNNLSPVENQWDGNGKWKHMFFCQPARATVKLYMQLILIYMCLAL